MNRLGLHEQTIVRAHKALLERAWTAAELGEYLNITRRGAVYVIRSLNAGSSGSHPQYYRCYPTADDIAYAKLILGNVINEDNSTSE
jgi:hypothetical protein